MKLALVTTPAEAHSAIGDGVLRLAAQLESACKPAVFVEPGSEGAQGSAARIRDACELEVFVEPGREGGDYLGRKTRSAATLAAREFDHVLYALGNEAAHGFMARLVRDIGGTVALHDWNLFDMACASYPALARGGWRGHALALREGGPQQALLYARMRRDERTSRSASERKSGEHAVRIELALNRSIVRFADSFVVFDERMRERILTERNAPTPIGVVNGVRPFSSSDADGKRVLAVTDDEWRAVAAHYLDHLERFPPPRTGKRRPILVQIIEGLRAPKARAKP